MEQIRKNISFLTFVSISSIAKSQERFRPVVAEKIESNRSIN